MITDNCIGYEHSARSGKYIQVVNASTLESLPEHFAVATSEEVNQALQKAVQAWRIYRITPAEKKAEFLEAIATGIEALGKDLIHRIMLETAYPEARVIVERNRTCAQLRMFAKEVRSSIWAEETIDEALPDRSPAPRPLLRKVMMPVGPVVVFGASNFPLAYSTAGGDVASALAAGCPVIVKAHDSHLGTHALVSEAILHAAKTTGMPDGVFSSLIGDGIETGKLLVTHPDTAAVGFTGSRQGGRALFDLGQQRPHPIPVFAEMGSVNPVFLLPGKVAENPAQLADQLVASMTMTVGQFCTNPGVLVAMDTEETQKLINRLAEALENTPEAHMLNDRILKSFHSGVATITNYDGIKMKVNRSHVGAPMAAPALAIVQASIFIDTPQLQEEIFGPYSIIVLCSSTDEMLHVAAQLDGQLTASIHAVPGESEMIESLVEVLVEKAGRLVLNGVPTGVEVCAAMTHGGPYPASTDSRFTAVGPFAIRRWLRPVTFQNFTDIGLTNGL